MQKLTVQSFEKRDIIDITKLIQSQIEENKFKNGLCHLFTPHTTCAVTTADLDPGTDQDYALASSEILSGIKFNHPHNPEHFYAHYLATITGPSLTIPVQNGELALGEWQRIVLLEFDGPKDRDILVSFAQE